jgi:hypothetical protein
VLGKTQGIVKLERLSQQRFPVDEGHLPQVVAVQVQQVEKIIEDLHVQASRLVGIPHLHAALQLGKARDITLKGDNFSVSDVAIRRLPSERPDQFGICLVKQFSITGEQARILALAESQTPLAI